MALVQSATTSGTTAPTFGSATTAGNLLVAVSVSTGGGMTFNQPAGFTSRSVFSASVFAGEVWTRIADGTETSVNGTVSGGGNGNYLIMEFDDAVAGGFDVMAQDHSNLSTVVTSQSTGSATASGSGLALAVFWGDSAGALDGGAAYSDSFILAAQHQTTSARGGIWLATKTVSAGSVSCTRSCTDTGDEMAGAMIIFLASGGGGGGGVTEITVTDGVYFYDGTPERAAESVRHDALTISDAAAHDLSRMVYDSIYLSDQSLLDLSRVVADDLFLDDQYYSILDRVLFDALLLASIHTAETSGGGVTEISVLDALLLASSYARSNAAQFTDSLLMSDAAFREAFTALSDSLALMDNVSRSAELTSMDAVLLNSLVTRAAEVLVQEALLLGDDVTAQRINAAAALLTFARLARRDHLGATLTTRDFIGARLNVMDILGVVTGHNKWRTD